MVTIMKVGKALIRRPLGAVGTGDTSEPVLHRVRRLTDARQRGAERDDERLDVVQVVVRFVAPGGLVVRRHLGLPPRVPKPVRPSRVAPERSGPPRAPAQPDRGWTARCQTETWLGLVLPNGSRLQSAQRSRNLIPASRAMRSSSDGQT